MSKEITAEQNSPEWFKARCGIPTASNASKLIKANGTPAAPATMKGYAAKLAGDLFAGEDTDSWEGNKYTERGHEFEDEARKWLAFNQDIDIDVCGFFLDTLGRFGCSPDGRIVVDNGLAEFKCLPKNHLKSILHYQETGKIPDERIPQMHMQMLTMDADYNLLGFYHKKLPKVVIRLERDPAFDKVLNSQITACLLHRDKVLKTLQGMM